MRVALLVFASALLVFSNLPAALCHPTENDLGNAQFREPGQCANITDNEKVDCAPLGAATEEACTKRKCCWSPKQVVGGDPQPRISVPWCYYPPSYGGYSSEDPVITPTGFTVSMNRNFESLIGNDIQTVKMDFKQETPTRLHVKITDPKQARFETPYPEVPVFNGPVPSSLEYVVHVKKGSSGFNVIREATQESIFSALDVGDLVYTDQFLEITGVLPKDTSIYGLGEHQGPLKINNGRDWKLITLFTHDAAPQENLNLYGSHPFYLAVEPSGNSHGFFLLNSNGIEFVVNPNPAITIRTIGGILDMYFFMGPTPADVVRQYAEIVGTPIMPPFWALGFHLCRWGIGTLNRTEEIWTQNRLAGIPFDTQWSDIDYMDRANDFTYDKVKFAGLPEFVQKVHDVGMHYVVIMDPGVSAGETPGTYPPYDEGIKQDIFVKDSEGNVFIGKVWNPVSTAFPDFTNPKTISYWTDMLAKFYSEVQFDGLWIDMNEPANAYSGTEKGCPNNSLEIPPYKPHFDGDVLAFKTVCMSAQHHIGSHYNTHNLYGFTEGIATHAALTKILNKRPMIISRSTFAGHGRYASHWSGDVFSTWYDMKISIPQMLSFNMFNIPFVGADICGFIGDATVPLCQRWSQLGAFYPFSRNHNSAGNRDQDPASMGPEVIQSTRSALQLRYSLLPYLYTLFYNAHTKGDTVARPVFFEFYNDEKTLSIDEQFLWGPWLLIAPVLKEGATEVTAYLPKGIWYSVSGDEKLISNGTDFTLQAPTTTIPLLIRGGGILPQMKPMNTTTEMRITPFLITVAPDDQDKAEGELYWDDGDSLRTMEESRYTLVKFTYEKASVKGFPKATGFDSPPLTRVIVFGVTKRPEEVKINGATLSEFQYDPKNQILEVSCNIDLKTSFEVQWT